MFSERNDRGRAHGSAEAAALSSRVISDGGVVRYTVVRSAVAEDKEVWAAAGQYKKGGDSRGRDSLLEVWFEAHFVDEVAPHLAMDDDRTVVVPRPSHRLESDLWQSGSLIEPYEGLGFGGWATFASILLGAAWDDFWVPHSAWPSLHLNAGILGNRDRLESVQLLHWRSPIQSTASGRLIHIKRDTNQCIHIHILEGRPMLGHVIGDTRESLLLG